jgi:MATE family multidrug resistance protein
VTLIKNLFIKKTFRFYRLDRLILLMGFTISISAAISPIAWFTDGVIVSRYIGLEAVSAFIVVNSFLDLVIGSMFFLRFASVALCNQTYHSKQYQKTTENILKLGLLSFFIWLITMVLFPYLFHLLMYKVQVSGTIRQLVRDLFFVFMLSGIFLYWVFILGGLMVAMGKTKILMINSFILGIGNMVADLLLVVVFQVGVIGVAYGFLFAIILSFFYSLWFFIHYLGPYFDLRGLYQRLLDYAIWRNLLKVNSHLIVRSFALMFTFYALTVISTFEGEVIVASNGFYFFIFYLISFFLDGFAHTGESLLGKAYVKKDRLFFDTVLAKLKLWGFIVSLFITLLFWVFKYPLIHLMSNEPLLTDTLSRYWIYVLLVAIFSYPAFLADSVFVALGLTKIMRNFMLIAMVSSISFAYFLQPVLGNHAIWLGFYVLMIVRGAAGWFFILCIRAKAFRSYPFHL